MSRSVWKGKYINSFFLKKKKEKQVLVWSRSSVIPNYLVNQYVKVYNGNKFIRILITQEKVGYKFGEFVFTRKYLKKIKKIKTK